MNFTDWIMRITRDTPPKIAKTANISVRTLQHQLKNDALTVENVIKIASSYRVNPIRELIDLGFIDEVWAKVPDIEGALRLASDTQLTDEILRRLEAGSKAYDRPVDELLEERKNVTPFRNRDDVPEYDPETMVASQESEFIPPDDEFIP